MNTKFIVGAFLVFCFEQSFTQAEDYPYIENISPTELVIYKSIYEELSKNGEVLKGHVLELFRNFETPIIDKAYELLDNLPDGHLTENQFLNVIGCHNSFRIDEAYPYIVYDEEFPFINNINPKDLLTYKAVYYGLSLHGDVRKPHILGVFRDFETPIKIQVKELLDNLPDIHFTENQFLNVIGCHDLYEYDEEFPYIVNITLEEMGICKKQYQKTLKSNGTVKKSDVIQIFKKCNIQISGITKNLINTLPDMNVTENQFLNIFGCH